MLVLNIHIMINMQSFSCSTNLYGSTTLITLGQIVLRVVFKEQHIKEITFVEIIRNNSYQYLFIK